MKKIALLIIPLVFSVQTQAQSLYGDMETWRIYTTGPSSDTIIIPNGWNSPDSLIFTLGPAHYTGGTFNHIITRSRDAHSGNFSAIVQNRIQGVDSSTSHSGVTRGVFTTAEIECPTPFTLTSPFNELIYRGGAVVSIPYTSFSAWIKYLPKNFDNGSIEIVCLSKDASGKDSVVGGGYELFNSPITSWTKVSIRILTNSFTTATTMRIFFYASDPYTVVAPQDSSAMYIDDIDIGTTETPMLPSNNDIVNVYPNPSNGTIYLHSFTGEQLSWTAFNINGQMVANKSFNGRESVNLSNAASGMYFYNITNSNGAIIQRGKFTIEK